ncbi:hypothetical protein [Methanobrevibacter oralis]|uniref:Zinc-ribbon domain-containing protein n=1 Tax=Methanobrevibacter oralis TaxID=66851 RepID=A0A166CC15_METOA|nr:hypothetical protein [Methanobrevibacter oralis]KZX13007.1 hypothetical protein MBORA_09080 [Methanobrevibacter oralis]
MVKIDYCPSCGGKLIKGSFICPFCGLDAEELFAKGYLLKSDASNNSIELMDDSKDILMNDVENDDAEMVIEIPEDADEDIVIPLDDYIDVDGLNEGQPIEIVVQVDSDGSNYEFDNDDDVNYPFEYYDDDDPYDIVYYEYAGDDED